MVTKKFEILKRMVQIAKDQSLTVTLMYSHNHTPRTSGMNELYKIMLYTNTFSVIYKNNVSDEESSIIAKFLYDNHAVDLKCEIDINMKDNTIALS